MSNKVPKIRFKGFTEDWEQREFGEIFKYERPDKYIVSNDEYSNSSKTPVLTANKGFILGYTDEMNTYDKESIIFDDFTLDSKYVDFPYMVKSSAIKILTLKDEETDNLRFSFERLNSTNIEIMGHARHYISVVQPTKTLTPNISEQSSIGEFFKSIDNLIELNKNKYNKLINIKKSMLEKMFPKEGEYTPEIRFKGFTEPWKRCELGKLTDITKLAGFEFTKYITYSDVGKIIAIRGLNVKSGKLVLDDVKYIDNSDFTKLQRSKLYKDDILFTYVGTVGELAIITENDKYYLAPNVSRIRIKNSLNATFIAQFMRREAFYNTTIFPLIATSSQPALSMENIRKFIVSYPSIEEQIKIGEYFQNIDDLINLNQQKLEKLKNIKKSLLEKMFV